MTTPWCATYSKSPAGAADRLCAVPQAEEADLVYAAICGRDGP
ncbi:MAG: hypothetical protein ACLS43_03490 [Evtepia gabavorous]